MKWQTVKGWFKEWWLLLIALAGAIGLGCIYWKGIGIPIHSDAATLGQLGDYFGGLLNPLVSTLTLFVAVSVWKLQKVELEQTKNALKDQAKTAEKQRQEQRFFDLLNLYQETLKTFVIESINGKAAFNNWQNLSPDTKICIYFMENGFESFSNYKNTSPEIEDSELLSLMEKTPSKIIKLEKYNISSSWKAFSPQLDHYFRTIFSILGELENLLKDDHIRYGKLFRDQLSRDELTLLAFHLLFDEEGEKMCPLVAKYGLLKYLAKTKLRDYALDQLDKQSFGSGWVKAQAIATPREETPC